MVNKFDLKEIRQYDFYKKNVIPIVNTNSIYDVTINNFGLHSARLSSPYMTLCSRLTNFTPNLLWNSLHKEKRFIKLRCMRTTLHTVPLDIAPIVHNSTLDQRLRICFSYYKKNKIEKIKIEEIKNNVLECIYNGINSPKEIESKIIESRFSFEKELLIKLIT